jgi:outer membrane protein assembly factor BamB
MCWWAIVLWGTLAGMAAAQVSPDDWPQFRGPGGLGVSAAKGLPTTWSATENVVWKAALPGPGTSSPIVVGDRIYLTYFTGYNVPGESRGEQEQLELHVLCLHKRDGRTLWDAKVSPKLPEQESIRDNHGYASSTPACDGERLYVFFGKTGALAFDLNGRQLWQTDLGSGLNGWGSATSPVLFGNLVFINASVESESLAALDKATGRVVWRAQGIRESWNTPFLAALPNGETELVVARLGQLLGFNPASGERLWSCANDITWYIVPSVVLHEGVLWSLGGRSGIAGVGVKPGGRGDVTDSHRLWTSRKGSNVSSPVARDGRVYWVNDSLAIAYCADARTGELLYEERIGGDQFYASPVLADGKIYYVARSGRVHVVAEGPKYEHLAANTLGDRSTFNASPAVTGNRLLLRSDRFLYCLGEP